MLNIMISELWISEDFAFPKLKFLLTNKEKQMSDKEKGTVKFFNDKKGYGFITKEDGTDVFVHFSSIVSENDFKTLKQDQAVEFEVESDDRGDKAVNVSAA